MIHLDPVELSTSGRPLLWTGEVERLSLQVDVQFEGAGGRVGCTSEVLKGGYAMLTTHRILWIHQEVLPDIGASCALPLSAVQDVTINHGLLSSFKAPKIRLHTHVDAQNRPAAGGKGATRVEQVKLLHKDPNPQRFVELAQASLARKAWLESPSSGHLQGGAQRPGPGGVSSGPPQAPQVYVNPSIVEGLRVMGFSETHAAKAAVVTNNAGVEAALSWLVLNEGNPVLDEPLQAAPVAPRPMFSTANAGVGGILRREEQKAAETNSALEMAFSDLRALMDKAKEMVELAERFRRELAKRGAMGEASEGMDPEMEQQLASMGIASPVTKETAGALYHQELSRQLADFLAGPVDRVGGMLALPDVYCMFNRARGTELVSPDDLLLAAQLFERTGTRLRLRTFPSGVLVVQSASHSDGAVCAKIGELAARTPASSDAAAGVAASVGDAGPVALTASDVAAALSVPLAIAAEHLVTAEARGVLCRDDGPEGLRFYRNFFQDAPICAA